MTNMEEMHSNVQTFWRLTRRGVLSGESISINTDLTKDRIRRRSANGRRRHQRLEDGIHVEVAVRWFVVLAFIAMAEPERACRPLRSCFIF